MGIVHGKGDGIRKELITMILPRLACIILTCQMVKTHSLMNIIWKLHKKEKIYSAISEMKHLKRSLTTCQSTKTNALCSKIHLQLNTEQWLGHPETQISC